MTSDKAAVAREIVEAVRSVRFSTGRHEMSEDEAAAYVARKLTAALQAARRDGLSRVLEDVTDLAADGSDDDWWEGYDSGIEDARVIINTAIAAIDEVKT